MHRVQSPLWRFKTAEHVDDVDGRGGIGLAIRSQGQGPKDTVVHPQHGVRSHAKRCRRGRIDQTTRVRFDLVDGLGKAVVQQDGRIAGSKIKPVHKLGDAVVHSRKLTAPRASLYLLEKSDRLIVPFFLRSVRCTAQPWSVSE